MECFYIFHAKDLSWSQMGRPSEFCTVMYVEMTWKREAEESTLLKFVTRQRLVKTLQIGEN
jgi:hypothetical protein